MPLYDLTCHSCGKQWTRFTPIARRHDPCECGGIVAQQFTPIERGIVSDDIPGGMVMEHIEPGRKVYSRTELKQVLLKHGYEISDNWTGPNDQFKKSWDVVDLKGAEEFIARHYPG